MSYVNPPTYEEQLDRTLTAWIVKARAAELEVAKLSEALGVLRDACGHCLAADRPPNRQMIDNADAALRGDWELTP